MVFTIFCKEKTGDMVQKLEERISVTHLNLGT